MRWRCGARWRGSLRPSAQIVDFTRRLAPEPRRTIKQALLGLRKERGDIRELEGSLAGYYRLRVGRFRIIFGSAKDNAIEAILIEERQLVYELFEAEFIKKLKS